MNFEEKQLSAEYKFEGRIIKLRVDNALLPDGKTATREVVEHGGGVCVAPFTDDGCVLAVRQYRYPYSETIVEIPAGKRDGNEDPFVCGVRELREETGATAAEYRFLGELYPSPGYCGEIIWMYAAKGLTFGEQQTDEDEFLSVEKIPLDKFVDMVLSGEVKDAKTQAAILKLKMLVDRGEF
ncbi:MAG: NUDIX hydrolase [Clostridia bacterium]|nr:NUDIX hydrolase [Clostridia bacterium]